MNLPNKITLGRIFLSILIIIILLFPFYDLGIDEISYLVSGKVIVSLKYIVCGILFVVASLTDYLDGNLARKNNMVTDFGKVMDAIADKILVNGVLIIMACNGMLPVIVPIIIILRDTFVDSIKMVVGSKSGKAVGASIFGKLKTAFMMIGLTFMFFSNLPFELLGFSLGYYLVLIACVLSIYSGFQYFISNKKILMKEI